MPQKDRYTIDGKTFTWTTDEGAEVTLPMRIKLKVIRGMADRDMDAGAMFELLEALVPNQSEVLDEMDVNDFQDMFTAWEREYKALSGASLGE